MPHFAMSHMSGALSIITCHWILKKSASMCNYIIIIIITSTGDLQPSTAIANQLPVQYP